MRKFKTIRPVENSYAELVKVRVPFKLSRYAWRFRDNVIMLGSNRNFSVGSVGISIIHSSSVERFQLDLKTGHIQPEVVTA